MDQRKLELLLCHQDLREISPELDPDEHLWKPKMILHHKGGRKQKVKVLWSDLTTTWGDIHTLFYTVQNWYVSMQYRKEPPINLDGM